MAGPQGLAEQHPGVEILAGLRQGFGPLHWDTTYNRGPVLTGLCWASWPFANCFCFEGNSTFVAARAIVAQGARLAWLQASACWYKVPCIADVQEQHDLT